MLNTLQDGILARQDLALHALDIVALLVLLIALCQVCDRQFLRQLWRGAKGLWR